MRNTAILLVTAGFIAGCTTEFTTEDTTALDSASDTGMDSTDTSSDTGGDSIPPDTDPDVLPSTQVSCYQGVGTYIGFDAGYSIETGCNAASSDCRTSDIWLQMVGDRLLALAGGEQQGDTTGFYLSAVSIRAEADLLEPGPVLSFTPDVPDDWVLRLESASLLQKNEGGMALIHPMVFNDGVGALSDKGLGVVSVWPDGGTGVMVEHRVLMNGVGNFETREVRNPRGVVAGTDVYIFFSMEESFVGPMGQAFLYGGTIRRAQFQDSSLVFLYGHNFVQMTDGESSFLPGLPDATSGTVVFPRMDISVGGTGFALASRTWSLDGPIPTAVSFYSPYDHDVVSTLTSDGNPAGGSIGEGGAYALAVLATDVSLSLDGLAPPYQLETAVVYGPLSAGMNVVTAPAAEVVDPLMKNVGLFDSTDSKILHDPTRGIWHYVLPLFPGDGTATIAIYSFLDDGTFASSGGFPFMFETGAWVNVGFDAAIDPSTGRIFLANYPSDSDGYETKNGFYLNEIMCDLVVSGG